MDIAIQIISFDRATKKWVVNAELDTLLSSFDPKASVKTIATGGPAREGKSFFNNQLAHDGDVGNVPQRFVVGHRGDPETHGIWAYARQSAADKPIVITLDLEGTGDVNNGQNYDAQLMALVTLLSSVLVYNVRGTISGMHLAILHGITQLVQTVTKGEGRPAARDFRFDECRGPMPHLWFLVQDAQLIQQGTTADEWLQEQLNPLPGETRDLGLIKREIIRQFVQRKIYRLPSPQELMTPEACEALPTTPASAWQKEYCDGLIALKDALLHTTPNLQLSANGRLADLPAAAFASLVRTAVDVVNDGRGARMCDGWPSPVLAPVLNQVMEKAKGSCDEKLRSFTPSLPLNDAKLQDALDEVRNAAAAVFAAERTLLLGATTGQLKEDVVRCSQPFMTTLTAKNQDAAVRLCNDLAEQIIRDARQKKQTFFNPQGMVEFQRQGDRYASDFKAGLTAPGDNGGELRVPAAVYEEAYNRVYQELASVAGEISAEIHRQDAAERERVAREIAEQRQREQAASNTAQVNSGVHRADAELVLARRTMMELAEAQRIATEKAKAENESKLAKLQEQLDIAHKQQNAASEKLMLDMKKQVEADNAKLNKQLEDARKAQEKDDAEFRQMIKASNDQLAAMQKSIAERPPPSDCCVAASSLVEVLGKGFVRADEVRVGDKVRSWDAAANKTVWSDAFYVSVSADAQPLVRLIHSKGAQLDLTYDHLVMVVGPKGCLLSTPAGNVSRGALLQCRDGTVVSVEDVGVTPREDCVAAILLLNGTLFVNGILCSCYDGHHALGMLENLDLRLLYYVAPVAVSGSETVRRYARWCDTHVHTVLRRWMGISTRKQQLDSLLPGLSQKSTVIDM